METPETEDISLESEVRSVMLNGKAHVVISATSDTATEYRNMTLKHVTMRAGGEIEGKLLGLAEAEPFLVSQCVYPLDVKNERGERYSLDAVKKWDNRAVKRLYNIIREISDIEEKSVEKAKN